MRQVSSDELVPGTLYYIQREIHINPDGTATGNGKQKGVFTRIIHNSPDYVKWCGFNQLRNVSGISGYGWGLDTDEYHVNSNITRFYLPEKEIILDRVVTAVLRNITGDTCFTFYNK